MDGRCAQFENGRIRESSERHRGRLRRERSNKAHVLYVYCTYIYHEVNTGSMDITQQVKGTGKKEERFGMRVQEDVMDMIRRASSIRGFKSVSEFIITTMTRSARDIIREEEQVLSTQKDRDLFFELMTNPPAPSQGLRRAKERYEQLTEE